MKWIDGLLKKAGTDKALHFMTGGLMCSLLTFVIILQDAVTGWAALGTPIPGTLLVALLSWVKEKGFDDVADGKDILAGVLGCVPVFAAVAVGVLFNILS